MPKTYAEIVADMHRNLDEIEAGLAQARALFDGISVPRTTEEDTALRATLKQLTVLQADMASKSLACKQRWTELNDLDPLTVVAVDIEAVRAVTARLARVAHEIDAVWNANDELRARLLIAATSLPPRT